MNEPVQTPVQDAEQTGSDPILSTLSDAKPEEKSEEKSEESDKTAEADKTEEPAEKNEQPIEKKEDAETEDKPESEQDSKEKEQEEGKEDKDKDPNLDPEEAKKDEARKRFEEREKVRAERRARVAEQTQNYVDSAEDEQEKRIRAMEVQQYQQTIEHTENSLIAESDRAKADPQLQMFNPNSEQFNRSLYEKTMKLFNDAYIVYDENGNMIGLKGSLYQHLKETAELFKGAVDSGKFQQVRDQRKMKVNADTKPAATPKEPEKDPILEVLQSE